MRRHVRWLHDQLPDLVARGVLDAATADRLRAHYGPAAPADPRQLGRIVLAVLGTTLVGAGVILLLAHNWDALGRPARAAIAIGLLLVPQGMSAFALVRRRDVIAWREGAGTALVLGLGACLALISQTFHLGSDQGDFLWTWIVLALAIPWVLDAWFPAVLVLAGIAAWPVEAEARDQPWMLLFLLALAPGGVSLARDPSPPVRAHLVGVATMVALLSTVAALDDVPGGWMLLPAATFGALAASAALLPGPAWSRPAAVTGVVGAALLCVVLSASGAWDPPLRVDRDAVLPLTLAASLGVGSLGGAAWLATRGRVVEALAPSVPLVAAVGLLVARVVDPLAAAILVDVVVGGASLAGAAFGLRHGDLTRTNAGLGLFSALLVVRFFDDEVPTVLRGVAFIGIGLAFLAVNARLLGARREAR